MWCALPTVLILILSNLNQAITLSFIGEMDDTMIQDSVGMGITIFNMLKSLFVGLNGAFETMASQALGSGNLELCGMYLQSGRKINTVVFFIITILGIIL